jgi:hypothetical protein
LTAQQAVLSTSGYAENSKPYDRERLAMMVRRVLGGPARTIEDPEQTGAGHQAHQPRAYD